MSHLVQLNFRNMGELDQGRIGKVLQKHIETARFDIVNRPCDAAGKTHKREIIIKLELVPETRVGDFGAVELEHINGEIQITSKLPAHRSAPIAFNVDRQSGGLVFNPDIPGEEGLDQQTLPGTGYTEGDDDE